MFIFNYIIFLAFSFFYAIFSFFGLIMEFISERSAKLFPYTVVTVIVFIALFYNFTIMIKYIIKLIKKEKLSKKGWALFVLTIIVYILITILYYPVNDNIGNWMPI